MIIERHIFLTARTKDFDTHANVPFL